MDFITLMSLGLVLVILFLFLEERLFEKEGELKKNLPPGKKEKAPSQSIENIDNIPSSNLEKQCQIKHERINHRGHRVRFNSLCSQKKTKINHRLPRLPPD